MRLLLFWCRRARAAAGAEQREGEAAGGEEWRLQGIETVFEGKDMAATAVEEGDATECDMATEVMGAAAGGGWRQSAALKLRQKKSETEQHKWKSRTGVGVWWVRC